MSELHDIRREYKFARLEIDSLDANPIVQFRFWLNEALHAGADEPNAMVLSTSTPDGKPSSRVVLLKSLDDDGFTFFTNYESRKGVQLASNAFGSLLFFWPRLERQVRIEGKIFKIQGHTSQFERDLRANIERKFTKKEIDVLYATSTLELGGDFDDINVLLLHGVPYSFNDYLPTL